MSEVISTTIEIFSPKMPPCVDFIENELKKRELEPLRWAKVNIENNKLLLSVSYLKM